MKTVEDYFEWLNNSKEPSLECMFRNETDNLGWGATDTLYSFLGIYVLGLKPFYPDNFHRTSYQIRSEDEKRNAYSNKYVYSKYQDFKELNDTEELRRFINNYLTIGNLIPIWIGGNANRGFSQCFDIPELYFTRDDKKKQAEDFYHKYKNAYVRNIIDNEKQIKLTMLLDMEKTIYLKFLDDISNTIEFRSKKISEDLMK